MMSVNPKEIFVRVLLCCRLRLDVLEAKVSQWKRKMDSCLRRNDNVKDVSEPQGDPSLRSRAW